MNNKIFFLSLVEILIDLVLGVMVLYITYVVFRGWFKKKYQIEEDNLAFRILIGGILFATGYCISGALQPIITTFKLLQSQGLSNNTFLFESVKFVLIFVLIGFVVSMVSSFVTLIFYNMITKSVDELQEIANGKISYAIFMAVVVITISLFTRDAYINMLESLMPYPNVPTLPRG